VCTPLVYHWEPGEVDPPASSQPRISNFRNFSTYRSRLLTTLLRHNLVTSPSRRSSQLQCSTKQHQQRPQTYVLELTSNFLILCSMNPNKPPRAWHISNPTIQPTKSKLDLCDRISIKRLQQRRQPRSSLGCLTNLTFKIEATIRENKYSD
jgi:hypothetical protein